MEVINLLLTESRTQLLKDCLTVGEKNTAKCFLDESFGLFYAH